MRQAYCRSAGEDIRCDAGNLKSGGYWIRIQIPAPFNLMPDYFDTQIRAALANTRLQEALDANAERRIEARLQANAALPNHQVLRRRAHSVRASTLAKLDEYLEQFITKAQLNGLIVHRAADAAQATQIVREIARENNAHLVAKSKSMISEEIGLNHALEAVGLRVVETDLGEYIIQLRGERPAHILTPAVHLSRVDVGQTFHESLGLPFSDDVPTLVAAARQALRMVFLEAEIGITGVNFGVAESGTLCLVTNEGNGRMVTTLPPVHIALMGIERLVPTLDNLALLLTLLPRAATGQKITVYTSLINSPRRPGDPDGPRQRHLILVDNGREALRQSPLAQALLCIRCGACLNACPVFREIGGHAYVGLRGEISTYPGPIGAIISPGLFGQSEFGHLARASSLCGACKEACPVDIDLPKLLLRVRAGGIKIDPGRAKQTLPGLVAIGIRAFTWFSIDVRRFRLAQRMLGFFSRILAPRSLWMHLPVFTGWGYSKDFPRPDLRSFRRRWMSRRSAISVINESGDSVIRESRESLDQLSETSGDESSDYQSLATRFAIELMALGGEFTLCSRSDLAQYILKILHNHNIGSLLSWETGQLPNSLLEAIQTAGIQVSHDLDPSIRAGLTGTLAAVADTGTLVLTGGPGRALFSSLLPEVHIAILRTSDIRESLPQVLGMREIQSAASVVLISGPSRTADIEMTLTIGVHGPRELYVLCLDE